MARALDEDERARLDVLEKNIVQLEAQLERMDRRGVGSEDFTKVIGSTGH